MNNYSDIIKNLPYDKPFLFVDNITEVKPGYIKGNYSFPEDSYFYKGHFKHRPVTPGVLLTECAAQIGLACYAVYKYQNENTRIDFGMTSADMEFVKPNFPGERITVEAEEIYHRFGKLKMKVLVLDDKENVLAQGKIAGMIINYKDEK